MQNALIICNLNHTFTTCIQVNLLILNIVPRKKCYLYIFLRGSAGLHIWINKKYILARTLSTFERINFFKFVFLYFYLIKISSLSIEIIRHCTKIQSFDFDHSLIKKMYIIIASWTISAWADLVRCSLESFFFSRMARVFSLNSRYCSQQQSRIRDVRISRSMECAIFSQINISTEIRYALPTYITTWARWASRKLIPLVITRLFVCNERSAIVFVAGKQFLGNALVALILHSFGSAFSAILRSLNFINYPQKGGSYEKKDVFPFTIHRAVLYYTRAMLIIRKTLHIFLKANAMKRTLIFHRVNSEIRARKIKVFINTG